jgi:hypothetical protein
VATTAANHLKARSRSKPGRLRGRVAPLPLTVLIAGLGVLLCSIANAMARSGASPASLVFWLGVATIAAPIAYSLSGEGPSARERLLLVCLLGLALYGVKVVRDAPLFSFSDEFVHAFNADQIVQGHHLFAYNPVLHATPYYPGLASAASALISITGISAYGAGVIVIGAARLVLVAAMFLLFERVSGSAKVAGLGAAVYAGNFNFLYWEAQFSYESLSLPLLVFVLMMIAGRDSSPRRRAGEFAVPIVLATSAIVVTHHLSAYALALFVGVLAFVSWFVRKDWGWPNPWRYSVFAAVLATVWLLAVASSTIGYLSPVLRGAVEAIFNTASGEAPARGLFQGRHADIPVTPLLPRVLAVFAVLLLVAAFPFALRRSWKRYRRKPFALVLMAAGAGFFLTLALRLAPEAWETGNRAGEILFIGLAFVLGSLGLERWRPRAWPRLGRVSVTAGIVVIVIGGAIAGWPWDLQLASPVRAEVDGRTIASEPLALAEWAEENLPDDQRFAAGTADARLLMFPGQKVAIAGKNPDIQDILVEPVFSTRGWECRNLRDNEIRYVVADQREVSNDGLRGYFFSKKGKLAYEGRLPATATNKFNRLAGTERIYASGAISVYDIGASC